MQLRGVAAKLPAGPFPGRPRKAKNNLRDFFVSRNAGIVPPSSRRRPNRRHVACCGSRDTVCDTEFVKNIGEARVFPAGRRLSDVPSRGPRNALMCTDIAPARQVRCLRPCSICPNPTLQLHTKYGKQTFNIQWRTVARRLWDMWGHCAWDTGLWPNCTTVRQSTGRERARCGARGYASAESGLRAGSDG